MLQVHDDQSKITIKLHVGNHDVTDQFPVSLLHISPSSAQIIMETLTRIIGDLNKIRACSGLQGFEQVMVCDGGLKTGKIWFSTKCEKVGASVVCLSCKKLYSKLHKKSPNIKPSRKKRRRVNIDYYKKRINYLKTETRQLRKERTQLRLSLQNISLEVIERKLRAVSLPSPMISNILHSVKCAKVKSASGMRLVRFIINCTETYARNADNK